LSLQSAAGNIGEIEHGGEPASRRWLLDRRGRSICPTATALARTERGACGVIHAAWPRRARLKFVSAAKDWWCGGRRRCGPNGVVQLASLTDSVVIRERVADVPMAIESSIVTVESPVDRDRLRLVAPDEHPVQGGGHGHVAGGWVQLQRERAIVFDVGGSLDVKGTLESLDRIEIVSHGGQISVVGGDSRQERHRPAEAGDRGHGATAWPRGRLPVCTRSVRTSTTASTIRTVATAICRPLARCWPRLLPRGEQRVAGGDGRHRGAPVAAVGRRAAGSGRTNDRHAAVPLAERPAAPAASRGGGTPYYRWQDVATGRYAYLRRNDATGQIGVFRNSTDPSQGTLYAADNATQLSATARGEVSQFQRR
jgi:hypothetical protein